MTGSLAPRRRGLHRPTVKAIASMLVVAAAVLILTARPATATTSGPAAVITPGPTGSAFSNGEVVSISVGPNSTFPPNSRIVVLECAAPGGVPPVNDNACDGNTVQYGSVLVAPDGSFEAHAYRLYQLPDHQLSETTSQATVCNATAICVLYIGVDQNDFTQPKTFSAPFTVDPSATPAPIGEPGATGAGAGSAAASASNGHHGSGTGAAAGSVSHPTSAPPPAATGAGSHAAPHANAPVDSSSHGNAPSGSHGLLGSSGASIALWLVLAAIVLLLLGIGGTRLKRRFAP